MAEILREEGVSEAGVHLGNYLDSRAEIPLKVCAQGHLILKKKLCVNFTKQNRDANSVIMWFSSKKSEKNGDRSAVATLKDTRQLGYVLQELEPPKYSSILRKSTRVSGTIRCVKFSKVALRHANIRESKGPSLGIFCPANPHEHSPYAPKFEDRSQERRRDKSDVPAERVETGQKYREAQRKGQSYFFFTY